MQTIRLFVLTMITGLVVFSCDANHSRTIVGNGDIESMEVELPDFSGVSVTGTCNVNILIGEPQQVLLSAQRDVLNVMTYKVRNGILEIGFKPDYTVKTNKEISADIVIPAASYMAVTGAGDFNLSGTEQDFLDINITGTGNVEAFDMEVDDCMIRISGTGNCNVNVANSLEVQISGVGNIFYKGNPTITSDISGVGNVTSVDH